MSVRATATHIDKYGVTHRIDLHKSGYGGSATEMRGTSGFIQFQHENLNESNPFATPVQKGRLEFGVWVESGSQAVIDELVLSQEGDWELWWYQDSVLFWKGTVAVDLTVIAEGGYPYEATIVAKDGTILESTTFTLEDERRLAIEVLADALNATGYDLPITTRTSWVCDDINTANDFLSQVYIQTLSLRDFNDQRTSQTDDTPWTMLRVVEEIARGLKLFVRQTNGVWLIEQMSAHDSPASVLTTVYDKDGAYVSASNADPTISANSVVKVVQGSTRQVNPALSEVSVIYDHRTLDFGIRFAPIYTLTGGSQVFSQSLIVDGTQTVNLTGTIQVELDSPLTDSDFTEEPYANIEIKVGSLWWDGAFGASDWSATQKFNRIRLFDSEGTGEIVRDTGTELRQFFAGAINITTAPIPNELTAGDTLTITIYTASTPIGNTTQYNGLALEITNNDSEKRSRAIRYTAQSSNGSTQTYTETSYFGSGPTTYSPGALLSSPFTPNPLSNSVISNWNRRGTSPDRVMSVNAVKEIIDQMRSPRPLLEAILRSGGYTPENTLSYDSLYWFYIGGSFDGYEGEWTAVFARNALATDTDVLATVTDNPSANTAQGLLQAVTASRSEAIEAQGVDMRLALAVSGAVTQIQVYDRDGYFTVKSGQILRLVHPVTLQTEQVTASADRSGDIISITPVTLTNSYPAGSYVFMSAESLSAGIVVGENAVRIYAEGQKIGRLSSAYSGTVTSIDCVLYTKVVKGTELNVVNSTTGETYSITVDDTLDTYGPGVVSLPVESQIVEAPTGSYIVGDNAWQSSAITVTQGLIVLKVDSSGRVAQVKLAADQDSGSEITISAEQVNINGIVFTEGTDPIYTPGDIATSNYSAGSTGWKIDGDGSAEFNSVDVRGGITATSLQLDIASDVFNFQNDAGDLKLSADGVGFIIDLNDFPFEVFNSQIDFTGATTVQIDHIDSAISFSNTTEATSTTTGSVKISGGLGVAKNVHIGGILVAPTVSVAGITDADSPYSVPTSASYIATDSSTGGITVNLPTGTNGRKITVFDTNGSAVTNTVTINRASTDTINGLTNIQLTSAYESVTLVFYSGNWTII